MTVMQRSPKAGIILPCTVHIKRGGRMRQALNWLERLTIAAPRPPPGNAACVVEGRSGDGEGGLGGVGGHVDGEGVEEEGVLDVVAHDGGELDEAEGAEVVEGSVECGVRHLVVAEELGGVADQGGVGGGKGREGLVLADRGYGVVN